MQPVDILSSLIPALCTYAVIVIGFEFATSRCEKSQVPISPVLALYLYYIPSLLCHLHTAAWPIHQTKIRPEKLADDVCQFDAFMYHCITVKPQIVELSMKYFMSCFSKFQ